MSCISCYRHERRTRLDVTWLHNSQPVWHPKVEERGELFWWDWENFAFCNEIRISISSTCFLLLRSTRNFGVLGRMNIGPTFFELYTSAWSIGHTFQSIWSAPSIGHKNTSPSAFSIEWKNPKAALEDQVADLGVMSDNLLAALVAEHESMRGRWEIEKKISRKCLDRHSRQALGQKISTKGARQVSDISTDQAI